MKSRDWLLLISAIAIVALAVIVALGMIQATSLRSPFRRIAFQVSPGVVSISAEKLVEVPNLPSEEEAETTQVAPGPRFSVRPRDVSGTGFIFDPRGYVMTSYHVISGYDAIVVRLADGSEFTGDSVRKVGVDPWSDIAVLKIEARRKLPVVKLGNSDELEIGDWVAAVGGPFGLQGTLTAGVVSAFNRSGIPMSQGPQFQDFIQTDASINPGNSGGPLVNEAGEAVGMNSGIRSPIQGNVGIGFAIPINYAAAVADELIARGRIVRGYLGLDTQPIDDRIQQALALKTQNGVLVSMVVPGGPADRAGIRPGDIITSFGNIAVTDVQQFQVLSAGAEPGKGVDVVLRRWGKSLTTRVAVAPRIQPELQSPTPLPTRRWLGLHVRNLLPHDAVSPRLSAGVVVDSIEPAGPADNARLKLGDVLVEIDGNAVRTTDDYQRLAQLMANARRPLLFRIVRGRQPVYIAVGPGG